MVHHYIPWFESALHAMYPSIPDADLTALAYGGLMDNQAFKNSTEYAMKDVYSIVNKAYARGASGHKCQSNSI